MDKYGFIGLGSQGGPMARRMIDAGLPTVVWARRPEVLAPFVEAGAEAAATVAELGAQARHVGICVLDDAAVREVCEQLMPAMAPGGRIVIHATIHPDTCKALAIQAAEQELEFLDAPVSGGAPAAEAGSLTVMVGGDRQVAEAARPVFETFAGLITHLGPVGAGQNAKLINNAMLAANLAIAHHSLEAARELGIDRQSFVELIKASSGRSFGFEVCARMPDPTAFESGARLLAKDVRLLRETLVDSDAASAIARTARPFLDAALK